jgi:hypothetical protein
LLLAENRIAFIGSGVSAGSRTHMQPVKVKRVECVLPSRCAVEHTLNFTAALAQELDSCTSSICNVGAIDALERVVEDFAEIGNVSIFLVIRVIRPYGAPCAGLFLAPRGEDG